MGLRFAESENMNLDTPHASRYPLLHHMFRLTKRVPWWFLLAAIGMTTLFFWRILFLGEHIAFRDGAHFYPPLFEYIQSEWRAGRVPLWNSYENLGQPLMANPVSSVFYPGKLVYFLPISDYHAYHLYVIGHFLLAALTCYRLARHFKCSAYAATIGTISYVFGGSVLFQYSNVVFLVGAAWLPEALTQADKLITTRRVASMLALAVVFAMFILGGDPQMAYHALVLILLLMFFYRRNRQESPISSRVSIETSSVLQVFENSLSSSSGVFESRVAAKPSFWAQPILLLGVSLTIAAALAAVQWLPALELGLNGDRQLEDHPVSLYKGIVTIEHGYREHDDRQAWDRVKDGVLCRETSSAGMARSRYNFSIGPWRLIEFVFPNANGRSFPINTNWGNAIAKKWPCSGIWSPSLYMGIIPFLLAFVTLRFRKSNQVTLWLSWGALIFLLGSFGYFGLGWVVNQTLSLFGNNTDSSAFGSPFGGIYWLFSLLLPGYDQFRYPAKLMTVVALMLALLSARGFDAIFSVPDTSEPIHLTEIRQKQRRLRRNLLGLSRLLMLASFVLIPLVLVPQIWVFLAKQVPADPIFGRFVADRALGEAAFSLIHVLNVLFLFWVVSRYFSRSVHALERSDKPLPYEEQSRRHNLYFRRLGLAMIVLVCCDMAPSNLWMVGTAKQHFFEGKPLMATFLDVQENLVAEVQQAEAQQSGTQRTETQQFEKTPIDRNSFPIRTWRAPTYSNREVNGQFQSWLPAEFAEPSQNRLTEWVIWEQATLSPRYPLPRQIAVSDVRGSIVTRDYYAVSQILRDLWRKPQMSQHHGFSLSEYLERLGNSSMIVSAEQKKDDYISQKQSDELSLVDPIELFDRAMPTEAESYHIDQQPEETESEPKNDLASDDLESKADIGQLHQWGRQQKSITQLLPYEANYWPLNATPRVTLVDRIEIETPLKFSSRKEYFSQSFAIIARSQRHGIPVVEHGKERFDHLPVRFAKTLAKLVALGDSPREHSPADLENSVGETELVSYEPQKVVVRAKINRPGFLILADQYDPNWRAELRYLSDDSTDDREFRGEKDGQRNHKNKTQSPPKKKADSKNKPAPYLVPILRTDRVLRGVSLPEGNWEITFVYNPLSFRLGATLSFFAWGALVMFLLGIMAKKFKRSKIWSVSSRGKTTID